MSLEALSQMHISVSSFARKEEDLQKTPAAVYVISKVDIARSAATSIPELLRMVPGVQVVQINASSWAVSARGFNSQYSSKLLVLIDGRTVYSEIYSGSQWDQIDLPLENIERIEVIRGPGAAVWGTNAVNGVINIISKDARSTQGAQVEARYGRVGSTATFAYGGTLGSRSQFHAFASYADRQTFERASGGEAFDGEDSVRAGARIDWQPNLVDSVTTSGDLYCGKFKQQVLANIELPADSNHQESDSMAGGYALIRWTHQSENGNIALQVSFDDQSRHELNNHAWSQKSDIDFQDSQYIGSHNELVWGGEFRSTDNHMRGNPSLLRLPNHRTYVVDAFAQDEIAVIPNQLIVTVGSRIQEGTLAGLQVQPSARILWAPDDKTSYWAAVSRAAAAPSLEDKYMMLPLQVEVDAVPPVTGTLQGNPDIQPETVVAYELGYRRNINKNFSVDLAGFLNDNRRLLSDTEGEPVVVPTPTFHIDIPLLFSNSFSAKSGGLEANVSWRPSSIFSLQASYSWMEAQIRQTSPGLITLADFWDSPQNSISASACWNFTRSWSANGFLSQVGALPATQVNGIVPPYTRMDLHLGRKLGHSFELDAGVTNLLTPRHIEFGSGAGFINPMYVPRATFIKGTWSF
jgi:iron complex outermembrane receptor protein